MAKSNLYTAINAVMAKVEYVQKSKAAQGTAISEAALIGALRPEMVAQGLVVFPVGVKDARQGNYQTGAGKLMNREIATMVYKLVHAPSGEHDLIELQMEASDFSDKAAPKLNTMAYKYALRQLFMIEGGDSTDKPGGDKPDKGQKQATTKPKPQKPNQSPAPENGGNGEGYGLWNATSVNNVIDKTIARDKAEALRWLKPLEDLPNRPTAAQVRDMARDYQGFLDASDTHPQAMKKATVIHNKKMTEKAKG